MSFERCHRISVEPTMLGPRWFDGGAQNSILWPCLFFVTPVSHRFFYWNLTWLWQLITLVRNHQILKTITFSESSGRSLSHGTTLYRSYLFIILSYLHFGFHTFPDSLCHCVLIISAATYSSDCAALSAATYTASDRRKQLTVDKVTCWVDEETFCLCKSLLFEN